MTGARRPATLLLTRSSLLAPTGTACLFSSRGRGSSKNLSNKQFLETELKENPEFFRAFPHLQRVFEDDDAADDDEAGLNQNLLDGSRKYESTKVVSFADLSKKPGFYEGLLHQ